MPLDNTFVSFEATRGGVDEVRIRIAMTMEMTENSNDSGCKDHVNDEDEADDHLDSNNTSYSNTNGSSNSS